MNILNLKFKRLRNNRFFTYGLPFMVVEMAKKEGIQTKNRGEVTLESEFEKVKTLDIEHWENIRGPRPWEQQETSKSQK